MAREVPDPNDGADNPLEDLFQAGLEVDDEAVKQETYFKFIVQLEGHIRFPEANVPPSEAQRILAEAVSVYSNEKHGPHIKVETQVGRVEHAFVARKTGPNLFDALFGAPPRSR